MKAKSKNIFDYLAHFLQMEVYIRINSYFLKSLSNVYTHFGLLQYAICGINLRVDHEES